MFDAQEWLNTMMQDSVTPRHRRLCFLITANGGLRVHGWGVTTHGEGSHQKGLDQDDALDLLQWGAFMDGLEVAGIRIHEALIPYYDAYQKEFGLSSKAGPAKAAEPTIDGEKNEQPEQHATV